MTSRPAIIERLLLNPIRRVRDSARLGAVQSVSCDADNLRPTSGDWIASVMTDALLAAEWPDVQREIGRLGITSDADGVNAGDRRAIYNMVRALRPERTLEVGTHIGASTVHISAAVLAGCSPASHVTTVDLLDVNEPVTRPWEKYGSRSSPASLVNEMGMSNRVTFVNQSSLEFLSTNRNEYDFIFLDGDHTAATVYQELPAALERLAPNGVVLLHDYFPGGQPLWSNGVVIPGPWLATERLRAEGAAIRVLPLGTLPWPTKLGTCVTSLALVGKST